MDVIINGSIILEAKSKTGWRTPGPADIPWMVPTTCDGCGRYVEVLAALDGDPRCLDCLIAKLEEAA